MFTHSVQQFLDVLFDAGATDYKFPPKSRAKNARTKKMWRLRLKNGIPVAVQIDGLVPCIWLAAEDEGGKLKALGKPEFYSSDLDKGDIKGSHSHLTPIEEFRTRPNLVQITVSDVDRVDLERIIFDFLADSPTGDLIVSRKL